MPPFNPASIGAPSPVGRGGGGGPTLIARRWFFSGTTDDAVPVGAKVCIARGVGGGAGTGRDVGRNGGGADFAKKSFLVSPGNNVTVSVGAGGTYTASATPGGNGGDTTATYGGAIVMRASGGQAYQQVARPASIGDVVRAGGLGGASYSSSGVGQDGQSGGRGGLAGTVGNGQRGGGGGSGGDRGDPDSLNIYGNGNTAIPDTAIGYGGGGGDVINNSSGIGQPGVMCLEYWSA